MSAKETTFTVHDHPYTYFCTRLIKLNAMTTISDEIKTQTIAPTLDEITLRQYLTLALTQFLGLTGAAIPVDILGTNGLDAWIRVQQQDGDAVMAALSQWSSAGGRGVTLRIVGRSSWLGGLNANGIGTGTGTTPLRAG